MLPLELEKNEGGKQRHCKLCNTTMKWSNKTKKGTQFSCTLVHWAGYNNYSVSPRNREHCIWVSHFCVQSQRKPGCNAVWKKIFLNSLSQWVTLRTVQCIQKSHKLILDLLNSKIKDSFVVNTILSLNTILISLHIYYMNKMVTYF